METLPKTHRFSVEEYHVLGDAGVFVDKRVELLEGEIIDMPPIGSYHGGSANRLNHFFSAASKGRWIVSVQNSLAIDDESEPEPDLMLLKPTPTFYTERLPRSEDVFLLIEIALSTVEYDRERKFPVYGRSGIRECWILNLRDQVLEVYREPHFTGYATELKLGDGDSVSLLAFPDVELDVRTLLKQGA